MRIAARDKRLEIVRPVTATGELGGEVQAGETVIATVWASKRTMSGREFLAGGTQERAEEVATFNIRWRSDLRATDKVRCDGREYGIEGIRELERRRQLEIHARAVSA
jgi:SPP1 family predicted phage head-tail adaptor